MTYRRDGSVSMTCVLAAAAAGSILRSQVKRYCLVARSCCPLHRRLSTTHDRTSPACGRSTCSCLYSLRRPHECWKYTETTALRTTAHNIQNKVHTCRCISRVWPRGCMRYTAGRPPAAS
jgi:hypothetical protein